MNFARCSDDHGQIVVCFRCRDRISLDAAWADGDGPPFEAYYCEPCKEAKEKNGMARCFDCANTVPEADKWFSRWDDEARCQGCYEIHEHDRKADDMASRTDAAHDAAHDDHPLGGTP
jgi:hypothetical protein